MRTRKRETIDVTCTTTGYTKYVCKTCGSIHEVDIKDPTGHDLVYVHEEGTAKHYSKCLKCTYQSELVDCNYTVDVVDPTCDMDGYTKSVCDICKDEVISNKVNKLDHDWDEWQYDGDSTPGDNEKHTHSRVCKRNPEHKEQGVCQMESVETAGSCTTPDSVTTTCKDCHISFTKEGPVPFGHTWSKWEQTTDGKHKHTCDVCGISEEFEHNYNIETTQADCENPAESIYTCIECQYTYKEQISEALGHEYVDWEITETHHKSVCRRNSEHVIDEEHSYTTNNLCDKCSHDALVYTKEGAHYIVSCDRKKINSVKEIIIPETYNGSVVSMIARSAFFVMKNIEKVYISKNITEIGENAFYGCSDLQIVEFATDSNLEVIGKYAFGACEKLNNVKLPNKVTKIDALAFKDCKALEVFDMPDTVTEIGSDAFDNTLFLSKPNNWVDNALYIHKHLIKVNKEATGVFEVREDTISISSNAFENCTKLTTIILHNKLVKIDDDAFLGCVDLENVEFVGNINEWLNIVFVNDYSSPLMYASNFHIDIAEGDIIIPSTVKTIPSGTFKGTNIESIEIPDSVTSIGAEAFENCTNLKTIKIATSVLYIGENAFFNTAYYNSPDNWVDGVLYIDTHLIKAKNEELASVINIKDGTTTIGINAFADCSNLVEVSIPDSVIRISAGAFRNCTKLAKVDFLNKQSYWFATTSFGLGRLASESWFNDVKGMAKTMQFYDGEWRRSA